MPWWLNQINWLDQINGARTLDVFDAHSYVGDNVDTTGFTSAQLRAAAGKIYRTYWDPSYENPGYEADWITTTEPNRGVTFLIPRLKALVNAIYPGTPLSFSEWQSTLVPQSEWDFSTALSDADAFGVMGREVSAFPRAGAVRLPPISPPINRTQTISPSSCSPTTTEPDTALHTLGF